MSDYFHKNGVVTEIISPKAQPREPAERKKVAALEVEYLPAADLIPYAANSRTHSDEQVAQIASSIRAFGFTNPILISPENDIIAGHGRLLAAGRVGLDVVPCIRLGHLTETERRAYVIADNRLALSAGWDTKMLELELKELVAAEFDIELLGFEEDELDALINPEVVPEDGLTDPDEVPEDVETRCKPGDLWTLGKHRLLCGDSTDVLQVERLMGGEKADFVYMDPPYGMRLNTNYAITPRVVGKSYAPVIGDDEDFDPGFWFEFFAEAREHFWWGADYYCQHLPKAGAWVVWDKKKDDLDESIGTGFELCWSKLPHKRMLARFLWSGFTAKERNEARVHPTQKPVALHEWFFTRWGKDGDRVVDLFLGSGSTLIACEKTARRCLGMEIDPKYCDVILARWEKFTGKTATLEDTHGEA